MDADRFAAIALAVSQAARSFESAREVMPASGPRRGTITRFLLTIEEPAHG
jgi:hypothetical protein